MAYLRIKSPTEGVTGYIDMEVIKSNIEIADVYWKDKAGKKIDKLIPKSTATLHIETKRYTSGEKIEIKLEQESGKSITTKNSKIDNVSVNGEGIATKEYEWSTEDTIIATAKGLSGSEKKASPLVKEWGIWIKPTDKSEMHYFNPLKPYMGIDRFIKLIYDAYYFLEKSNATNVFKNFINKNSMDVYIEKLPDADNRNVFNENRNYNHNSSEKQLVGIVLWNPRVGSCWVEEKTKLETGHCPIILLVHELGHANEVLIKGHINHKQSDERGETDVINNWETPAAIKLKQGVRPKYGVQREYIDRIDIVPTKENIAIQKEMNRKKQKL